MGGNPISVGSRSVTESGNSWTIALPKKELKEQGVKPDDILGESVRIVLDEDGKLETDLGDLMEQE